MFKHSVSINKLNNYIFSNGLLKVIPNIIKKLKISYSQSFFTLVISLTYIYQSLHQSLSRS